MRKSVSAIIVSLFFAISALTQHKFSDREADELKRSVQKVVTVNARLTNKSGESVEGKRIPDIVATYDSLGNLVKREVYLRGSLLDVYEYGFLEGDRVVKITRVGPPDSVGGGGPGPKAPPDPRYTFRFKYKYDTKGNRTEEFWYGNDGSLRRREVSAYDEKGNRVERSSYIPNAKQPSLRIVAVYNDRGDVIEETVFRVGVSTDERWSYRYAFDSNGNWVKRERMRWVTKEGKSYFEPYDITHRSITYF